MRYAEINNRAVVDCQAAHAADTETLREHLAEVHQNVLPTRTRAELLEWHSPDDWKNYRAVDNGALLPAAGAAVAQRTPEERVRDASHASIRSLTPPDLQWLAESLIATDPNVTVEGARQVIKAEFYRRKGQTVPSAQEAASVEFTPETILRAFTSLRSTDGDAGPALRFTPEIERALAGTLRAPAPEFTPEPTGAPAPKSGATSAPKFTPEDILRAFTGLRS